MIKTHSQISGIEDSAHILKRCFHYLESFIKEGISTFELDQEAQFIIEKEGARSSFKGYHKYPYHICVSINDEVIHGLPSRDKIIASGSLVSVDCGICYKGYYTDAARTYAVEPIAFHLKQFSLDTQQSLLEGIYQAKTGNYIHDISQAIYDSLNRKGYGVVREFCGHGVGLNVHEAPEIPNIPMKMNNNVRLKKGMVLAIEPMSTLGSHKIYIDSDGWTVKTRDKSHAAHWEHTILVDEEPIILT